MNEPALLAELRRRDIHVSADGDQLQCDAPAGALTPELRDLLRKSKSEILEFLRGPAELSFSQEMFWFLDRLEQGAPDNIIEAALDMRGLLDATMLERALGALVGRHEALRTVFLTEEGRPLQVVSAPQPWTLPVEDLSGKPDRDQRLRERLKAEVARGFDLTAGPLFRARIFRLDSDSHVLLLTMHHIISDGWSTGVLIRELGELYARLARGEAPALPALALQFRDFARWQRGWLRGETLRAQLSHWRARLLGAPQVLELHADRARPAVQSHRGSNFSFMLPRELADGLHRFARQEGATLFMALLSGFTLLLSRYSGQADLLVGTPVANRGRPGFEPLVGCFFNIVVLRADLSGDPSAARLLARMREVCLDAIEHQMLPFKQLVEALQPQRDLSRNPLVQVMFAMGNAPAPLELPGLTMRPREVEASGAQVDLTLVMQETAEGLRAIFNYATDLFEEPSIARMAAHLRLLLEGMVANPGARLKDLPILGEAERRQLLVEWNATRSGYAGDALVQGAFEAQAQRGARRTALRVGKAALSYGELEARANRLAQALRARGVGRGQRVGVCLERGAEMLAAVLGILKAGAAYVPLDPSFPQERLRFMAEDAQLALLVSSAALAGAFGLPRERQLLLDADAGSIASAPEAPLPADALGAQPADPAYVIYTSGSTGKPKGVVVPHRAVVNFLASMAREPGLGADDVLVAVTTLSFDIAVLELQLPLAVGATVVMASRDEAIDGRALRALLEQSRATVLQATPVTWRLLLEAGWSGGGTRFKALVGGEALPRDLADQLLARGVELWNMYGPTETTVWSTCARISGTANGISIGKPIANTVVRVLDAQGNLCPIGVPGELCIGGDGLSLGYWNRPELTAERFIPDPFGAGPAATLYRTGDRARWRDDGTLEHLGRLDFQVKLRGYRIELGEIEAGIARHPAVREAVVVAREDVPGDKRLVAYLVTENPPADLVEQLRALVRASMPEYMLPAHFVSVDALPLTPNGKIDRKSLPPPQAAGAAPDARAYLAPRNDLEISLATAWEKVLGVARVGIQDNFFELGGNSLSVLRLIFEMKQASGIEIALGDVFRSPTIAGLITHLSPDAVKDASVVVPLQPQGDGLPIFCICGINIYKDFAQSLGKSQPVFGVYVEEEQAIIDQVLSGDTPTISIKQLVDAYDKAIARFRPQGPYRLAGLSFGGVLAMELASKLRRRGEQVDLVFLLDTMLPEGWHRNWAKWLSRQVAEFMTGKSRAKLLRLYARLQDRILKQPAQPRVRNRAKHMDEMFRQRQGAAFLQASAQWQADQSVVDFPVVLFRASEHSLSSDIEIQEDYGWRRYLGERLSIVDVSGGHISIIEPPNVADLASKAQRFLCT